MSDPKQKMETLIKTAATKAAKNDWDGALSDYREAMRISPASAFARMKAGECCAKLGKRGDAVQYLTAAARMFAGEGSVPKATALYKSILRIDPNAPGIAAELSRLTGGAPAGDTLGRPGPGAVSVGPAAGSPEEPNIRDLLVKSVSEASEFSLTRKTESALPTDRIAAKRDKIELFRDMSYDEFRAVVDRLTPITFPAGEMIIREGDTGDSLYVITEGRVGVFRHDDFGNEVWVANLEEGSFFGEFGFFSNARRFASVRAQVETTVLELTKRDADMICVSHPGMKKVLISFYKKRVLDTLLAASPLFSRLTPEKRATLLERFTPARFAAGDVVITQGTQGTSMYLIRSGNAQVIVRDDAGGRTLVSRLLPGDFFGELALLTRAPRTADVVAETDLALMEITRDDLRDVVREHPEILEILKKTARTRL
jgi:CRP-like cAMP-binding protein